MCRSGATPFFISAICDDLNGRSLGTDLSFIGIVMRRVSGVVDTHEYGIVRPSLPFTHTPTHSQLTYAHTQTCTHSQTHICTHSDMHTLTKPHMHTLTRSQPHTRTHTHSLCRVFACHPPSLLPATVSCSTVMERCVVEWETWLFTTPSLPNGSV